MEPDAAVTISRPSHRFVDRPMTYTVWIDGQEVGAIHDGETQRFSVTPGNHQVRLGISGRAHLSAAPSHRVGGVIHRPIVPVLIGRQFTSV